MKHCSHVTQFCLQVWGQKNKRDPASAFGLESHMMKFKGLVVLVVPLTRMDGVFAELSGDYRRTGNLTVGQRDYRSSAHLQDSFIKVQSGVNWCLLLNIKFQSAQPH